MSVALQNHSALSTFQYQNWTFQRSNSVETRLYKSPPPYFIVLASSVETKEVKVIEFHRIDDDNVT